MIFSPRLFSRGYSYARRGKREEPTKKHLYFCYEHGAEHCMKTQKELLHSQAFVDIYFGNFIDNSENLGIIQSCMDMKKVCRIPYSGNLPELNRDKLLVGTKQLRKALRSGKIETVYLAENADPNVTEPLQALCAEAGIQPVWVRTMAELGRACGIDVGAAAAGVAK